MTKNNHADMSTDSDTELVARFVYFPPFPDGAPLGFHRDTVTDSGKTVTMGQEVSRR